MSGEKKPDLKRDGTMQVTAKEGVQFIMATGDKELLEMQGLVPKADGSSAQSATSEEQGATRSTTTTTTQDKTTPSKPRLPRESTMVVTAKEGERYLKESWAHAAEGSVSTEPAAVQDDDHDDDGGGKETNKPKLAKYTTMLQTKQEGEAFVSAQGGLDEDAKTRNQQDKLEKIIDEPAAKKAKSTDEAVSEGKKPSPKRVSTIVQTAKEGEELLKELGHKDDNPDSDRRRTRSQTRGGPPPPPPAKRDRSSSDEKESKGEPGKTRPRGRPKKSGAKSDDKPVSTDEDSKKEDDTQKSDEDEEEDDVKSDDEKVVTKENDSKIED